jgi:predicted aspartyl protease
MSQPTPGFCFTVKYQNIANCIKTKAMIGLSTLLGGGIPVDIVALWDTGATGSLITTDLAKKLSLQPISKTLINTPSGESESNIYSVDLYLPNGTRIINVRVLEGIPAGCDMLIGMDVIGTGDLSITNYNRKTTFSFRMPSMCEIDFVQDSHILPIKNGQKVGPNDLCPCGSGKKYKKCHGRP